MNVLRLWRISEDIQTEVFLRTQMYNSSSQKDRMIEEYEQNMAQLKSNSRWNSIFTSMILLFPAILALQSIERSIGIQLTSQNQQNILFASSISIGSYYLFNFLFMLLFGLMTIADLMEGGVFRFLNTLPFSKSELQVLGIFTFVRLLLYQLVVMLTVFPIGVLYYLKSWPLFGITILLNFVNLWVISYCLIIIIKFFSKSIFKQDQKFNIQSIIRIIFMVIYILTIFSLYYIVGTASDLIQRLFELSQIPEITLYFINIGTSVIAFPFTVSYILSQLILGVYIPGLILSSIVGTIILITILYFITKRGNSILLNIAIEEENISKSEEREEELQEVDIKIDKPKFAYLKMSLLTIIRDMSATVRILMAIIFPLIPVMQGNQTDPFTSLIFYSGFILFISENALSTSEGSLGGLLASLPFSNRSMFRIKHLLLSIIFFVGFGVQSLVTWGKYLDPYKALLILALIIILPNVFLLLKSIFFGKINGKYTLYNAEPNPNMFKNMIIIIPILMFAGGEMLALTILQSIFSPIQDMIIFVGINIFVIFLLEIINRMVYE